MTKLSIHSNAKEIKAIFEDIENQSEYVFIYLDGNAGLNKKVSVDANNQTVDKILDQILASTDNTYKIVDRQIYISAKDKKETKAEAQQQKGVRVSGVVKDAANSPLVGVNVTVKGTTVGVMTDLDGKFTLSVPDANAVLVFSYVGFTSQEKVVGNNTIFDITLKEDEQVLSDVVIVGYGTQKKENLTGAVAQVDSKVFENRPVTSATSALQGTLPGVNINPNNGNPNSSIDMNIRGTTSVNGGSPLVLIDGVETSMSLINPNDIESVTVLKDAAASSIYGVRAAFGVILVTTKKGAKDEKLKISYSGNFSWSKATVMPEFTNNSYDHATFVNDALAREGITPLYDATQYAAIKDYYENPAGKKDYYIKDGTYYYVGHYDWVDRLISNAIPKQNHNISVSGGSGKTTFYSSFGYSRQEGPLKVRPDIYQRKNARLTVENNTYDWMTIGLKVSYNDKVYDQQHTYKDNLYHSIVFSSPTRGGQWWGDPDYPEYDKYIGYYFEDQSPLGYLQEGSRDKLKANEIVLSPSVDLRPMKNWNIHVDFTYNRLSENSTYLATKIDKFLTNKFIKTYGNSTNDYYEVQKSDQDYMSFNAFTDYSFSLNEQHNFKALLGFNQEVTKYSYTSGKLESLLSGEIPSLSLGTGNKTISSNTYDWALRGGFFRLNYDFEGKYLFEGNLRYDGTSRFPKDDRFVLLPSFSVGWRISEESLMKFTKPLFDNIKIRGSYGNLGNQLLTSNSWSGNTKYYPYIPLMSNGLTGNYMLGSAAVPYVDPYALTPNSLTWEKVSTINGGLDLTLLKNRLEFSFDIYNRTTKDMLFSQDAPSLLGASAPVRNTGELQTKGWEITASWHDKIGEDFTYGVGLSLYDSQAKITKFDGGNRSISGYYEGKKIGEIWGFETVGFFTSAEDVANSPSQSAINSGTWTAGDIKYADLDGSTKITKGASTVEDHGDLKVIGNTTPRYSFGINLNAEYKGIYTTLFFQGVGKRDFWPSGQAFWPVSTQYFNTQKWFITDSWSETNTDAYFPIPRARNTKNQQTQTKYLQDASYIRLKNFTLGYSLPKTIVNKIKLSNINIYFSGENLWEHSGVKGAYDPEGMANAGAMYYPIQRSYSFGVDITF